MKKIFFYSVLLTLGLVVSQIGPHSWPAFFGAVSPVIRGMTMLCLAFIMIHVGLEFEIDKTNVRQYGWDYVVAATAAAFPWIFCAVYFIFVLTPPSGFSFFSANIRRRSVFHVGRSWIGRNLGVQKSEDLSDL
jgi:hypothetical protein